MEDLESAAHLAYSGKRILVTGAAGSIGSRLIMHLIRFAPLRIAALDKDENAIYELEQVLSLKRAPIPVELHLADIRDAGRLESVCHSFAPQIIFHAAAYKNVPLMELHPGEAVLGNVLGTKNLLDVVAGFGAERFVFVSTDDAASPINVVGATKRIGEMLVQVAAQSGRVQAGSIRFGNILGSRGSVILLFQRQIVEGGPVTVTHPDVMRYFLTMQQAVQSILAAGCEGQKGEIFVADQGRPRNIQDLAREMILLAGLEPEKDIVIRTIGLRPGERHAEALTPRSEKTMKTRFNGLSLIDSPIVNHRTLLTNIGQLIQSARSTEPHGIRAILGMMGLGYKYVPESSAGNLLPLSPSQPEEHLESLQSSPSVQPLRSEAAN